MTCDECGTELVDECLRCGALQCCPKCCIETTIEVQKSIIEDMDREMGIDPSLEDVGCK